MPVTYVVTSPNAARMAQTLLLIRFLNCLKRHSSLCTGLAPLRNSEMATGSVAHIARCWYTNLQRQNLRAQLQGLASSSQGKRVLDSSPQRGGRVVRLQRPKPMSTLQQSNQQRAPCGPRCRRARSCTTSAACRLWGARRTAAPRTGTTSRRRPRRPCEQTSKTRQMLK